MRSIQELGTTILSSTPEKIYIIGGTEYGVKDKYLSYLQSLYKEKYEYESFLDVIDIMSRKHLIPLQPALYVVRYDESFVKSITDAIAHKIKSAKVIGTIVCLYSDAKSIAKIDKYLPDLTYTVDSVNPKFIKKYLHSDFPGLDDRSIQVATNCSQNYGHARNICKSMMNADLEVLNRMSEESLAKLFGCEDFSTEKQIQVGVASRNFNMLLLLLDRYNDNYDSLLYTILQTMIELEKISSTKYSNSDLKEYAKRWTPQDIYFMFMNTYSELEKLRSTTSDAQSRLIYLFGLLTFDRIPAPEVMNEF